MRELISHKDAFKACPVQEPRENSIQEPIAKFIPPMPDPSGLPASLKPRKSNFGTTVYFNEPVSREIPHAHPEEEPGIIEKGEPELLSEAVEQVVTPEIKVFQEKTIAQENKEIAVHTEKKSEIEPVKESVEMGKNNIPEIAFQAEPKALVIEHEEIDEEISILKKKEPTQEVAQSSKQLPSTRLLGKRKGNIMALTKGFIENFTDEGNDWLKRDGDDSKRPSLEELKYLSYEQHVSWQLQSSWKRNFEFGTGSRCLEGTACVAFALNEQGNLLESQIIQSSGDKQLDSMILQNIKNAAPFPPLPKHFNTNVYKTSRRIHVMANRF